jgi:hypothetical protein
VSDYLRKSISNGNPREQALIRRWWHEEQGARGRIVWEYFLEGRFADAMWFPDDSGVGEEEPGQATSQRFPLAGRDVVLCEAKGDLTPAVVGQALVYARFASRAGANVRQIVVLTVGQYSARNQFGPPKGTVSVYQLDDVIVTFHRFDQVAAEVVDTFRDRSQ